MNGDKGPGGGMVATTENQPEYQLSAVDEDEEDLLFAGIMEEYALGTGGEPRTLNEALSGDESDKWRVAVQAELDQIEKL
ncbi:hypothetical protein M378DRAFT_104183, partial [Amanita muscaria Koide BX008]